ncbi:ABC transporter permease, partial [Saccharothrix sp. ST-888]|uniref:ABC transporter permease n=1 Tax=Saccharothrix sp. ST-888 TaxID=1427391 RepID=UPI0005ECC1A6
VNGSVLVQALILAVLGSTHGLFVGIGLPVRLNQLMSAVGMNLPSAALEIGPAVPLASYTGGTVITLVAPFIPPRRAGKLSPLSGAA